MGSLYVVVTLIILAFIIGWNLGRAQNRQGNDGYLQIQKHDEGFVELVKMEITTDVNEIGDKKRLILKIVKEDP